MLQKTKISLVTVALLALGVIGWTQGSTEAWLKGVLYAGSSRVALTNSTGNLSTTSGAFSTTLAVTGASALTGVVTQAAIPVYSIGAITAGTTQTQAGATAWGTKYFNVVTTGNAADGISLPAVVAGKCVAFKNISAVTLKVYGLTPAKVNTAASATGAVFAASTGAQCCSDGTDWFCTGTSS